MKPIIYFLSILSLGTIIHAPFLTAGKKPPLYNEEIKSICMPYIKEGKTSTEMLTELEKKSAHKIFSEPKIEITFHFYYQLYQALNDLPETEACKTDIVSLLVNQYS